MDAYRIHSSMNLKERIVPAATGMPDRLTNFETWERGSKAWPSNEQQVLTCCRVLAETHDVKTFYFRTTDDVPVRFEPGQFLTISAVVKDQTIERCYTISSPPTRPYLVSITVKRVPGGTMSNFLHDNLAPGHKIRAFGPSGTFTPTSHHADKLLYLSAGSGVTPLMSMTRSSIDLGLDRDIAFVHSARTPDDIVFREELKQLAALSPRLQLFFICEGIGDGANWRGATGRLNLEQLSRWLPDFTTREVFTCGPAGYMKAVRAMLQDGGHDQKHYHEESFDLTNGVSVEQAPPPPTAADKARTYTVTLSRSSRSFVIDATETVLVGAKRNGIAVPSSCSQGVCGTCKTKLLEGTVEMQHRGGIRDREIDKGLRLLCCSRATSNLVLDM